MTSPFVMPAWAMNAEAQRLLTQIQQDRPERDKPLTQTLSGTTASFGYRGGPALLLRRMWEAAFHDMISTGPDSPERRAEIIAYADANNADELISRMLGFVVLQVAA